MNSTSPLQLAWTPLHDGVLHLILPEESDPEKIPGLKRAIDGRMKSDKKVRKVIFDLSGIDPLMNAAGRLLDLACETFQQWKIPVEARIPADIYEMLHEIEPHRVPSPDSKPPLRVRRITVQIVEPLSAISEVDEAEPAAEEVETPITVLEAK